MENEISTSEAERRANLLKEFEKIAKANVDGYAGCMPNGNLVDRREHPEAFPVAENPMFNITAPRCIKCENITPEAQLVKSLCRNCRPKLNEIKTHDGAW